MKLISPPKVLELTAPDGSHVMECFDLFSFEFEGYLKAFDPNFRGVGAGELTSDIKEALRFKSFMAAAECWKMQSDARPFRSDGKPNRPLTAYTVQFTKVS